MRVCTSIRFTVLRPPPSRTGRTRSLPGSESRTAKIAEESKTAENCGLRLGKFDFLCLHILDWNRVCTGVALRSSEAIADSAQLIALAPEAIRWVDMGSGAGFPGLVIAIQLAGVPGAIVHCIESEGRKCAFLREAARATGAAAAIHPVRVEAIEPESLGTVDAVTARAFAPLPLTLKLARPWMERGAIAVFPRGESAKDQIPAAPEAWTHAIETLQSVVNPKAAILRIRQG